MKVVNLKQAILQAWKEPSPMWLPFHLNLAEALMEQAMIGPSPNPLILSYLKYAISSRMMVSYSSVLLAISLATFLYLSS
uniref:Mediator of RNA polymerase II transcription subunit 24 n=1 Tax=Oncorhynchus mykiss TaxID=8022 RepID=A0A8C7QG12_ONCMY